MPLTLLKSWGVSYCKSRINYKHSEGNKISMDLSSTHIFVKKVSVRGPENRHLAVTPKGG